MCQWNGCSIKWRFLMMLTMGYDLCCPGYWLRRGIGTVVHTTPDCSNDVIALFATSVSSCNNRSYESLLSNKIYIKSRFLVLLWRCRPICRGSLVSLSMMCLVSVEIDYLLLHLTSLNVNRSDIDRRLFWQHGYFSSEFGCLYHHRVIYLHGTTKN